MPRLHYLDRIHRKRIARRRKRRLAENGSRSGRRKYHLSWLIWIFCGLVGVARNRGPISSTRLMYSWVAGRALSRSEEVQKVTKNRIKLRKEKEKQRAYHSCPDFLSRLLWSLSAPIDFVVKRTCNWSKNDRKFAMRQSKCQNRKSGYRATRSILRPACRYDCFAGNFIHNYRTRWGWKGAFRLWKDCLTALIDDLGDFIGCFGNLRPDCFKKIVRICSLSLF